MGPDSTWLVRKNTCVRNGWIKERLRMGIATNFSDGMRRIEQAGKGDWGFAVQHGPFLLGLTPFPCHFLRGVE